MFFSRVVLGLCVRGGRPQGWSPILSCHDHQHGSSLVMLALISWPRKCLPDFCPVMLLPLSFSLYVCVYVHAHTLYICLVCSFAHRLSLLVRCKQGKEGHVFFALWKQVTKCSPHSRWREEGTYHIYKCCIFFKKNFFFLHFLTHFGMWE